MIISNQPKFIQTWKYSKSLEIHNIDVHVSVCVYKQNYYRRNHELVKDMEEVGVGESDGNDLNTMQVEILKKLNTLKRGRSTQERKYC